MESLSFSDFIQQLKDQTELESVVREQVPSLTQSGSNCKGLCPFHNEKTPSFYVHPELGYYKCFGCGVHGDVITFVQEIERVDFKTAVEQLARRIGLEVPSFKGVESRTDGDQKKKGLLRELSTWAREFFTEQLCSHPRGHLAGDYLAQRGLTGSDIQTYRLGYAPDSYDALLRAAETRNWTAETLAEAGLASRTDRGSYIDRFRDRIMFPITDRLGQVVAFAGRTIESDDKKPKYINTAETPIFKKSELLYGLAESRESIRESGEVILLEGYMDWIAMHRNGLKNALAGMGTALTEGQARLIKHIGSRAILLYDGDEAGQKAMLRSSELLLKTGMDVRAAALPSEHDPDTYLSAEGSQAMRDLVSSAPSTVDYFAGFLAENSSLITPEAKAETIGKMAPLLMAIQDPVTKDGYIKRTAERFGIRAAILEELLKRRSRTRWSSARPDPKIGEEGQAESAKIPIGDQDAPLPEQNLLHILLKHLDRFDLVVRIEPGWIQHPILRSIFEMIHMISRDIREGAEAPDDLFKLFTKTDEMEWLSRIMFLSDRRFGGEITDFEKHMSSAFMLQCLKLQRSAVDRRKRELRLDLQVLTHDPAGREQLEEIHEISMVQLKQMNEFLGKSSDPI
jgi:DNA primase